jgi:hypothetical protein
MHHGSRWTAVALATLACSLSLPASAQGRPDLVAASLNDPGRAHVAGEVLVQFRRGATDDQKAAALHGVGGRIHDDVRMGHERQDGKGDLHLVKLPPGLAIAAAVRDLERDAGVEFAEPNWIYRHEATSNDTYFVNGSL